MSKEEDKNTNPGAGAPANDGSSIPPLILGDEEGYSGDQQPLADYAMDAPPASSSTMYKYRDFGHVAEDDEDVASAEIPPPAANNNRGGSESSIRVQKFPVKLYAILAQQEFQDIICWMPHGRSWKVLKPSMFESLVMPLFFEYSNYHSFNRLVNAWSFRRISSGPDRGSYYHELFLRGKPHLQKYMRRLPKTHKKLPMKKKDEPDFYALDKSNPLPAVEDAPIPGAAATVQAMRANLQQGSPQMSSGDHIQSQSNSGQGTVVTPSLSPNHAQQMMSSGSHHNMMPSGNVNLPNMGMGNLNGMQNGMQGGMQNGMQGSGGGMMNQQQQMMMNNQGMGLPMLNGMQGPSSLGMPGGRGPALNPRYGHFDDLPSGGSHDEFDSGAPQPMMGLNGFPMNNGFHNGFQGAGNGGRAFNGNNNSNSSSPQPNGMRRPVPMRQGPPQMDPMQGGGNQQQQQQAEYYSGYAQQQQQSPMMPPMQQAHFNRGATASPAGNSRDDYSAHGGSQSNGNAGGMSRAQQQTAGGETRV